MSENTIIKNYIEQKNNIKVIWFDEQIKNEENQNNFKQLKLFFNNIEQYQLLGEGFENFYINSKENKNEFKIILVIVSGRLFGRYRKKLQDNINKIINIPYTFIFTSCNFKKILLSQVPDTEHILSYDTMIMVNDGFYNPGGVYDNFEDLLNEMKIIINKIQSNHKINPRIKDKINYEGVLTFEYLENEEDLLAPALYKEIITNEKITKEDYKNFNKHILSFNNELLNILIKNLNLFKYIPFEILSKYWSRCYTIESDFYKVLNNKLMKSELSFNYKTFIKMLYIGVEINSLYSYKGEYLYRGSSINKEEIDKIKKYKDIGKLSSIVVFSKAFLSFSEDENEARKFCGHSDDKKIGILFILENNDINSHQSNANIQNFSVFPDEKEILFFPGTSFIIKEIRDIDDNKIELVLNYNGKFKEKYKLIYDDNEKINNLIKNNILTKNIAGKELKFLKGGKYLMLELLEKGELLGLVYKGKDLEKDEIVAIKEIDVKYNNQLEKQVFAYKFISEKIKYSCKYRDHFKTDNHKFYIILDYYDDDLNKYISKKTKKNSSPNLINKILKQLNLVFEELLKYNIVHRNIKPSNILIKYLNEEKTIFDLCLTDYGLHSKIYFFSYVTTLDSEVFVAPHIEYLYTNKCDLFSIGIIIYYLYFGKYPYETYDSLLNKKPDVNFKIEEDEKLDDLIKKLVKVNVDERISWEEYLNHPFFEQYYY